MDAPEASCSSRNVVADSPMSLHSGRAGAERVHESHSSASGGNNTPLVTMLETHAIYPVKTAANTKLSPTLPRNVCTSVIQSSWIKRLKPFSQRNGPQEYPENCSTKQNPVCTHFTKDFSSCSRRLNKSSHHSRSSSWPPHALRLQSIEHFPLELREPADTIEEYDKAMVISTNHDYQSIRVSSNNIAHSNKAVTKTGRLFAQQQGSCKHMSVVERFVPSARSRENHTLKKLNNLVESDQGGDNNPKDYLAQRIQNSIEELKEANSFGDCNLALQIEPLAQRQKDAKNWNHSYCSCGACKGDVHSPVLPVTAYTAAHSRGASADADHWIHLNKDCCMGNKILPLQTSFVKPDCVVTFPQAVVSENRVNIDNAGEDRCFGREVAQIGIGSKDARNSRCMQTVRNFEQFKDSVAKPSLLNNYYDVRASRKSCWGFKTSSVAEALNKREIMTTCAVGSRTVEVSGSLKQDGASTTLDTFHSRENDLLNLQYPYVSEDDQISRPTLPVGLWSEDAARSRIREISLGEYWNSWVKLLEGADKSKPAETGSLMAKSQHDFAPGEYRRNLFRSASCNGRLDGRQKFENYCSCNPHTHVCDESGKSGGCNTSQRIHASSSKNYGKFLDHGMSFSQRRTGWGQACQASAEETSHFSLKGATGRVDSQLHNKDSVSPRRFLDDESSHSRMQLALPSQEFCNNERTGEGSSMHEAWIRRWHSSAKFSATSGKAIVHVPHFSRSLSSGQIVKSYSATVQWPLLSSHNAMSIFDHDITKSGRERNRYMEASGMRLDSGSASTTPAFLLAGRNFAAFRSCAEAMVLVGKSPSKLPPTSLQNREFLGLPCANPKFVECEKLQSVHTDDSKALEHCIDDS